MLIFSIGLMSNYSNIMYAQPFPNIDGSVLKGNPFLGVNCHDTLLLAQSKSDSMAFY